MKKFIHTKQHNGNDCGLACASTMLKFYGLDYSIDFLRDLTSDKPSYSLKDIKSIFMNFKNLNSRALRVNGEKLLESLSNIKLPCIALLNDGELGHYVVIYSVNDKYLTISDPLKDKITKIPISKFQSVFTSIIMEIHKDQVKDELLKKSSTRSQGALFLKELIQNNKLLLGGVILLSVLVVILTALISFFLKFIVDLIIPRSLSSSLATIALIFLGIALFKVIFDYTRNYLIVRLSYKIDSKIANKYFFKIKKLPIKFFENREDGEIISRFNDGIYIRNIFSVNIITAILDIIIVIGLGITLYRTNNTLFLTILLPLLLLVCLGVFFYEIIQKRNEVLMRKRAKTTSFLVQFIKNMTTIHSFNKSNYFFEKFSSIYNKQLTSSYEEAKTNNNNDALKDLIQGTFAIIFLWVGTQQVLNETMSLGSLFFINSLALFLLTSLDRLVSVQSEIQKGLVAANRYLDIVNYPVNDEEEHVKLSGEIREITLRNFNFSHDRLTNIIEEVNLTINASEKILLVGESGSGKSSFVRNLVKFYKLNSGEIFINGRDITEIQSESIREKILYLNENPFLFNETIRENLLMGREVNEERIHEACQKAEILDFILSLDSGLEYKINENAVNLSTGQKQRLSLARAILHEPEVLILDESLSNVDKETSVKILNQLLLMDCLLIIITHNTEIVPYYTKKILLQNKHISVVDEIAQVKENKREVYI